MPDFEWSPEAKELAIDELRHWYTPEVGVPMALDAAVRAQPVVALPPCPTCKGACEVRAPGAHERPLGCGTMPCQVCNGSGVERLVPVSEIVAWLRDNASKHRDFDGYYGGDLRDDLGKWLNNYGN